MNSYEKRFYDDIHKLVKIQGDILEELRKMNKPLEECVVEERKIVLTEEDLEVE